MIVYWTPSVVRHAAALDRASASILSMSDTARSTILPDGIRFDRGSCTAIMTGTTVRWRDTAAGRPLSVDVSGADPADGRNPRLAAMATARSMREMLRVGRPIAEMIADGGAMRRAYVALRTAAAMADMAHADVRLQSPWSGRPAEMQVYFDGPEPLLLRPDVASGLTADVAEAALVEAVATGEGSIMVAIGPAVWEEEVDDGPVSRLRLMAENGMDAQDLMLRPRW